MGPGRITSLITAIHRPTLVRSTLDPTGSCPKIMDEIPRYQALFLPPLWLPCHRVEDRASSSSITLAAALGRIFGDEAARKRADQGIFRGAGARWLLGRP